MLMVQTSLCDVPCLVDSHGAKPPVALIMRHMLHFFILQARIQALQDDAAAKRAETADLKRQTGTKEAKIADALVVRVHCPNVICSRRID